jgi:hypothetical protein
LRGLPVLLCAIAPDAAKTPAMLKAIVSRSEIFTM